MPVATYDVGDMHAVTLSSCRRSVHQHQDVRQTLNHGCFFRSVIAHINGFAHHNWTVIEKGTEEYQKMN